MRRLALLLSISVAPRVAHADRAMFGLDPPPAPAAARVDCSDGLAFGCAIATDPFAETSPYGLTTYLSTAYLRSLPVADATQDDVAHHVLGGSTDGAGAAFGGATGLENRWTLDGAPADGMRTGAADSHVPLVFLDGITVTTGGFTAHDRASTGGTVDAHLLRAGARDTLDAYAWITYSTPPRDFPPVPASFTVRTGSVDFGPSLTAAVVATGRLASHLFDGHAWYAAGIAPTLSLDHFNFTAQKLVDADGDDIPDGLPGVVATQPIDSSSERVLPSTIPAMVRAGYDRGAHHLELSLLGNLSHDTRALFDSSFAASGVDRTTFVGDAIATYRGTWTDTHVRVQAAYHDSIHRESAQTASAANIPQNLDAYIPAMIADDPALAAGCASTRTDKFEPCPVPTGFFTTGGAGTLTDITAARTTVTADVDHRLGVQVLRAGVTVEDTEYQQTQRFTGNAELISLFAGEVDTRHFLDVSQPCDSSDPTSACTFLDASTLAWHTRYSAGYAEDTLTLAPGVIADVGLRYEYMQVANAFHLGEPAPRLGLAWDVLGDGTSRVWASLGRSYPLLPAGIGAVVVSHNPFVDDLTSTFGNGRAVDTGAPVPISAELQAPRQDELTAGVELAILQRKLRVTAWAQARYFHDGFETTFGTFDNPGRSSPATPEAERQTEMVALEIQTPPTAAFAVRAGWAWGRTLGTWTGPYDPRQGAILYGGTDFDQETRNLFGVLPTSLGHRVYAETIVRSHVHGVPAGVSARLSLSSGLPRDALGDADEGIVELLPRGAVGNNPMISQLDLRLFARVHGFDLQLELFDTLDRRDATGVDEIYAGNEQSVRPIVGGTYEDLIWLRDADGTIATRRPSYAFPTAFQAPLTVVLGAHRAF